MDASCDDGYFVSSIHKSKCNCGEDCYDCGPHQCPVKLPSPPLSASPSQMSFSNATYLHEKVYNYCDNIVCGEQLQNNGWQVLSNFMISSRFMNNTSVNTLEEMKNEGWTTHVEPLQNTTDITTLTVNSDRWYNPQSALQFYASGHAKGVVERRFDLYNRLIIAWGGFTHTCTLIISDNANEYVRKNLYSGNRTLEDIQVDLITVPISHGYIRFEESSGICWLFYILAKHENSIIPLPKHLLYQLPPYPPQPPIPSPPPDIQSPLFEIDLISGISEELTTPPAFPPNLLPLSSSPPFLPPPFLPPPFSPPLFSPTQLFESTNRITIISIPVVVCILFSIIIQYSILVCCPTVRLNRLMY